MKEKGNIACEMTGQAVKAYDQAFQQGLKLQEEARQSWAAGLKPIPSSWDWQDQFNKIREVAASIEPQIKKQTQEAIEFIDKSAKMQNALQQKATQAAMTPIMMESQAKWMEFWKMWAEAVQKNAQEVIQMDVRVFDSWIQFMQKQYMQQPEPAKR